MKLWYREPAEKWTEALPIGNGRLGAMVFGGVAEERLQLNDDTLWSGSPKDWNNPRAKEVLPELRKLIFEGKYTEADLLTKDMLGPYTQNYLPLCDLKISFHTEDKIESYERSLDLEKGIARVEYVIDNVRYTREVFSSFPDQTIVMRIQASEREKLAFSARLESLLPYEISISDEVLVLKGVCPENSEPNYYQSEDVFGDLGESNAIHFEGQVSIQHCDGAIHIDSDGLHVREASTVTLLFTAATSFNGYDKLPGKEGKNPAELASTYLNNAHSKGYEMLYNRHVADVQA